MIEGKRLVCVTPAGRRRYLEILAEYVLRCPEVDRWDLWANTTNEDDLDWMRCLELVEPRVRVVKPTWPVKGNDSIAKFYEFAADPDAVYVRLDDDVVWIDDGAIRGLAEYRINNPEPAVVYGNVLNTSLTNAVHQRRGRLTQEFGAIHRSYIDPVGWGHGGFARDLHERFLSDPDPANWLLPDATFGGYDPHPVIVISWLGSDMRDWWREIGDRECEEMSLSHFIPKQTGRPNVLSGQNLFVHYATWCQRAAVDLDPTVLDRYRKLAGLREFP